MEFTSEPYIGPRPFEVTDRDVFFGRTQEANELVSLITAHAAVLLYAQSGAGKTSLVKAGLIPLLVDEEKFKVIRPMRVSENVAASQRPDGLRNVYMFNALSSISEPGAVNGLADLSLLDYLGKTCPQEHTHADCSATTVIFDQFEELFTLYPERWEDRKAFFVQISEALESNSRLRVLFSMREDFIAELDPYVSLLPEKLRTRLRMERLRRKTALGAVTQPLERIKTGNGRRKFAPNVAEELVKNLLQVKVKTPDGIKKVTGEFVDSLQLQVVCQALWHNLRDDDDVITQSHLEAYGDVDKALVQFYDEAVKNTVRETSIKEGKLRQWFERALITPTGTRGTVFRGTDTTGGIPNAVVDELENQRIIRMELRGGAKWYELTHDRFVETVQTANQNWLLLRPATEQVGKRLEQRAADWVQNGRSEKHLLDDVELRLAEGWIKNSEADEIEPSADLVTFVNASRQQSETRRLESTERRRRMHQQARLAKLFRRLTLAISIVALIGFLALIFAGWQWWVARRTAQEAQRLRFEAEAKTKQIEEVNKTLEEKNLELSRKDMIIETSSAVSHAYSLMSSGKLDEAEEQFESLLKTYEQKSDFSAVGRTHSSLGDISLKRGQHSTAVSRYDKALAEFNKDPKSANFANSVAQAYARKGALYFDWGKRKEEQGDLKGAVAKFNNSFGFYQKAMDSFGRAIPKNNVGIRDAKNGFDEAKRRHDEIKQKQAMQAIANDNQSTR